MDKKKINRSIFAISAVSSLNTIGLTVILSDLANVFIGKSIADIQLLQTIPNLFAAPTAVLCGYLIMKFCERKIIITSFIALIIVGIISFFTTDYTCLLLTRILAGFAFGVHNPIKMTIISKYFHGDEKAKVMGNQTAFSAFSGFICNILVGWLTLLGYKMFFTIYIIVVFALIVFYFNYDPYEPKEIKSANKTKILGFNRYVIQLSLCGALYNMCNAVYGTNLSLHITQNLNGNSLITGLVSSIHPLSAVLMGLCFGWCAKKTKYIGCISMLIGAVGLLLIGIFPNQTFAVIIFSFCMGNALIGSGQAISLILTDLVKPEYAIQAIAISTVFNSVATTISPYVFQLITEMFFNQSSTIITFRTAGIITIFAAVITFYTIKLILRKEQVYERSKVS